MLKKKITALLLLAGLLLAGTSSAAYIGDMSDSNWAYSYVSYMVDKDIMPLESDGNFYGDTLTTRGEFVLYLWRALGCPMAITTGYPTFTDVDTSDTYYEAVGWAVNQEVTSGTSETTFDPDLALTREQAFTFLWRALPFFGVEVSSDWGNTISSFNDIANVSNWARTPMSDLHHLGIVAGTDDGYLMPLQDVARSATAAILYRTMALDSGMTSELSENQVTLYLLINGEEQQYELGYSGELTPEKLMDGLTNLTGMKFSYTHFDQVGDELRIHWSHDVSFMPDSDVFYVNPDLGFDFYDVDSTVQFMLDSAWKTMSVNLDIPHIYFSNGSDDGLNLSGFMNWAIPGDQWYSGNFSDYFEYLWTESGVSPSQNFLPYEAWAVDELTENQQVLYRKMRPKILAMEPFSYDAATYGYDTLDDVMAAWGALKTDEPQINNYFTIYENIDKKCTTISLDSHYFCSWTEEQSTDQAEISKGLEKFDQVCEDIVASMPENASTYEKYRYLAQVVSERADYDYSTSLPAIAAPYGIITGKMICQGYAETYQILCQRADLWCRTVSGASAGVSHAWNLIWLDSGTYHVDITWADEQGEPGSEEWMRYFMLTQEKILSDHIILDETVATGSPLFSPKGPVNHISEEDAIDLVKRAMDERNESASVIILEGSAILEGEHCLTLSAGSYSADGQKYTAMYHYAVSDSGAVYYIDVLQGADWNLYQWDATE